MIYRQTAASHCRISARFRLLAATAPARALPKILLKLALLSALLPNMAAAPDGWYSTDMLAELYWKLIR